MITTRIDEKRRQFKSGFTLVETLLAASLFMLFVGAAIFSIGPSSRGCDLDQGAVRMESILRFARAEAANTGRRVRVAFAPEHGPVTNQPCQVRLLWEPEPLDEPEVFCDFSGSKWDMDGFDESVNVEQVRLTSDGESPAAGERVEDSLADEDDSAMPMPDSPPITFNPDGSSDSAEIVLAARSGEDSRRVTVRVVGITGAISREVTAEAKGDAESAGSARTHDAALTAAE